MKWNRGVLLGPFELLDPQPASSETTKEATHARESVCHLTVREGIVTIVRIGEHVRSDADQRDSMTVAAGVRGNNHR